MNSQRHPLYATTLPDIDWQRSGKRILLDPAADDLARYQIYRYCSLPEATQLLTRGEWAFAHPGQWPDKYEQHLSRSLFAIGGAFARIVAHVKCLSLDFESNALWRTYAGPAGVLRIGIALQDLVVMLNSADLPATSKLYITRNRYFDERDFQRELKRLKLATIKATANDAMRALAMKRSGFAYENEVRICLVSARKAEPAPIQLVRGMSVEKIKSISIDPYLPAWQAEEIRRLLVERMGVSAKVRQSAFDAQMAD